MNGYHVNWPPRVRDRLLEFIVQTLAGSGRETAELNRALTIVEDLLSRRPTAAGESRAGDDRVITEPPLAVEYRVNQTDREVTVIRVSYSRGRRS